MKFKKYLAMALCLVSAMAWGKSPAITENTFFWQIDKAGQPTSYLYGYMGYSAKNRTVPAGGVDAFYRSEQVIVDVRYPEKEDADFEQKMKVAGVLLSRGDLEKSFGETRLNAIRKKNASLWRQADL